MNSIYIYMPIKPINKVQRVYSFFIKIEFINKFYFNKEAINSLNFIYRFDRHVDINRVHRVYSFFIKIEFINNIRNKVNLMIIL